MFEAFCCKGRMLSPQLPGTSLKIPKGGCSHTYWLKLWHFEGGEKVIVPAQCNVNLEVAIRNRVVAAVLKPENPKPKLVPKDDTMELIKEITDLFAKIIGKRVPLDLAEALKSVPRHNMVIYLKAFNQYPDVQYWHSFMSNFVKMEKLDSAKAYLNLFAEMCVDPRLVFPRHPRFNLEVHRYFNTFEHDFFDMVGDGYRLPYGRLFAKMRNPVERALDIQDKIEFLSDYTYICLDISRCDWCISAELMEKCEHSMYLEIFNQDPLLKKLLSWQLSTRGYLEDKFRNKGVVTIPKAGRASGDRNTSLGNSILVTGILMAYCKSRNISFNDYTFYDDGDDIIVLVRNKVQNIFLDGVAKFFEDAGCYVKVDSYSKEISDAVFCQARYFAVPGETPIMVRDYKRILNRYGVVHPKFFKGHSNVFRDYMYTLALSERINNTGVPVLGPFFRNCELILEKLNPRFNKRFLDPYTLACRQYMDKRTYHEPSINARELFSKMYGIDSKQQIEIENSPSQLGLSRILNYKEHLGAPMIPIGENGVIRL